MKILKLVLSVRPIVNILGGAALVTVLVMELYLKKIPEFFESGSEIGEIVYRICLSIISSYVFYFFVVHLKADRDRKNINVYLERSVKRIFGRCSGQIAEIARHTESDEAQLWEDRASLELAFQKIDPNSSAPLLIGLPDRYANWLQYFDNYKQDTLETINKIYRKMPFLDSDLVVTLAKLEGCVHFMMLNHVNMPIRNTTLEVWADGFFEYAQICKEVKAYYNGRLVPPGNAL